MGYTCGVCYNHQSMDEPNYEEACCKITPTILARDQGQVRSGSSIDSMCSTASTTNQTSKATAVVEGNNTAWQPMDSFWRFGLRSVKEALGNIIDVVISLFFRRSKQQNTTYKSDPNAKKYSRPCLSSRIVRAWSHFVRSYF